MADDDTEYGLVLPFVACASKGGPYDDDAFAAGYHLGQIFTILGMSGARWEGPVRSALVAQLDLVAMHYGLTLVVDHCDDEWSQVRFVTHQEEADEGS